MSETHMPKTLMPKTLMPKTLMPETLMPETLMPKQFWVIGGEYRDSDFRDLDPATSTLHGPFSDYDEANRVWRERSLATRWCHNTRYTIVMSAPNPRSPI